MANKFFPTEPKYCTVLKKVMFDCFIDERQVNSSCSHGVPPTIIDCVKTFVTREGRSGSTTLLCIQTSLVALRQYKPHKPFRAVP